LLIGVTITRTGQHRIGPHRVRTGPKWLVISLRRRITRRKTS